jgi:predicted nucleic acid-binding protein
LNLYAESSAILSWLLGDEGAERVREVLSNAEMVLASDLTLVECDRVLVRAVHTGRLSESAAAQRAALLSHAAAHWLLLRIESEVLDRARRPFPAEPLRTLDALHLASALLAARSVPNLALLSLDLRVRRCGQQLGVRAPAVGSALASAGTIQNPG